MRIKATLVMSLLSLQMLAQKDIRVVPLSINSEGFNEYCAVPFKNGIVFCSDRQSELINIYEDSEGRSFQEIFYSERNDAGKYINRKPFNSTIKTALNDGPVAFNKSGDHAFITRNHQNKRGKHYLGLYTSTFVRGKWSRPLPMHFNNQKYSICHATLSADGKKLIFASDMPGGYGGFDLYSSVLNKNSWSTPVNLGPIINTSGNEVFPFLHSSGKLFYSAAPENEKLDIFISYRIGENWQKPERLPEPFNSAADDLGYYLNEEETTGYFSSNREGSDNIYEFRYEFPRITTCDTLISKVSCFEFYEKGKLPTDLPLGYEWSFGDGAKHRGLEVSHCYDKPGIYKVSLNVIDTITGQISFNEASYDLKIEDSLANALSIADTCYTNRTYEVKAEHPGVSKNNISGWFWEIDSIGQFSEQKLDLKFNRSGKYLVRSTIRVRDGETTKMKCLCKQVTVLESPEIITENFQSIQENIIRTTEEQSSRKNLTVKKDSASWMIYDENQLIGKIKVEEDKIIFSGSIIRNKMNSPKEELGMLLNSIADFLKNAPVQKVNVYSYAVSSGDEVLTLRMSQERAKAVAEYLVSKGVEPGQINYRGFAGLIKDNELHSGIDLSERIEIIKE